MVAFVAATLPFGSGELVARVPRRSTPPPGEGLGGEVVAVRVADLAATGGVQVVAGLAGPVRDGDPVAWALVKTQAPAVVGPDGRVQAQGYLPDHVRLGALEQFLGDGLVEQVAARAVTQQVQDAVDAGERVVRERNRVMTRELTIRFLLAMTLMPNASYLDVLAHLAGELVRLPWARAWQVPTTVAITRWRRRVGWRPLADLFSRVCGHIVAVTDPDALWRGLILCALDGCQVRVPDTPPNRNIFDNTSHDSSVPFPMVRMLLATARAGRAILGAQVASSTVGEQTLTARLVQARPDLFTAAHVYLVDRNFLGADLIHAIHRGGAGAHLVMRVSESLNLPRVRALPDGSYESYLRADNGKVRIPDEALRSSPEVLSEIPHLGGPTVSGCVAVSE
jgi:hypothetical protein